MAWFSRRGASGIVPEVVLSQLKEFGVASIEVRVAGGHLNDPRFDWDSFLSFFLPAYQADFRQAIEELYAAAGDDLYARFGGCRVVAEFDGACKEPLYLEMMDAGLQLMYNIGLASGNLTGYEAARWVDTQGSIRETFDRIIDVHVPADRATSVSLAISQCIMVAKMGPGSTDNEFFIERVSDQKYGVFSLREWESGTGYLSRCEERDVPQGENVGDVLRSLGQYLRLEPYWAHDELRPYFVERRDID